ncbi:hypothetical protein E2562_038284 [Oryza meyeriana var. granulata]|uniref:Uncharacterized protein n=1 Tax=Oryza meyeriana var. granulata TaxID=110450 RepID=A0A6G1C101_9ORYZ|nr:hypothetical protein E2562_038284 [Oryza meyeriana var. granulata]
MRMQGAERTTTSNEERRWWPSDGVACSRASTPGFSLGGSAFAFRLFRVAHWFVEPGVWLIGALAPGLELVRHCDRDRDNSLVSLPTKAGVWCAVIEKGHGMARDAGAPLLLHPDIRVTQKSGVI